jgi:hypothetical protein
MGTAKVVSLSAQPSRVAFLGFEVGGILDTRRAELGHAVKDIPYGKLIDLVKGAGTVPGDYASRLKADAQGITELVRDFTLATLRNEDRKASLDSAINTRENIFFSKHANSAAIISTLRAYYWRTSPASKVNRLATLSELANQQMVTLQEAYQQDDRVGVVRETTSTIGSNTSSEGGGNRTSLFTQHSVPRNIPPNTKIPFRMPLPPKDLNTELRFSSSNWSNSALTVGVNFEPSDNWGRATGRQESSHVDYEYRTPSLEARAREHRAQISLMDQRFESYMFEQNMPHLEQIFKNELASIDNDVHQLQVALLRSFLIAPFQGVVTGVYKHPGDAVSAGEPVLRLEDQRVVHVTGTVAHYGAIPLGAAVTLTTTLGGATQAPTTVNGRVVAARGMASSGRWEVVVEIDNVDGAGNYVLPLNYWFDPEYTDVTIA